VTQLPKQSEASIQSQILEWLGYGQGFFWRNNTGALAIGEGKARRYFRAGTPGSADILGVYKGRAVAFEVKTATGKVSQSQKQFEQAFTNAGGVYRVVRSLNDVIDTFHTWGEA